MSDVRKRRDEGEEGEGERVCTRVEREERGRGGEDGKRKRGR
jgi:hypothetical protein